MLMIFFFRPDLLWKKIKGLVVYWCSSSQSYCFKWNFKYHCLCSLLQWNWKMPIKKSLKYFSILRPTKSDVKFKYLYFYFNFHCFVYVIRWVIKLIHLKVIEIFEYFLTKNTWYQIWICHMEKCLILFHFHCLGSHFSHKTEKSRFLKSLKYINFFDPKK